MITLDPEDDEIRTARMDVESAIEALKKAVREHDVSEPSMYKYCETYDKMNAAQKRLALAYATFGRLCFDAM